MIRQIYPLASKKALTKNFKKLPFLDRKICEKCILYEKRHNNFLTCD